jgi:uncharacterized protein (TIGR00251 family)
VAPTRPASGYLWDGTDLIIETHVQPRASREGFAGEHNGRIKIQTSAAPTQGKANARLRAYLARSFGVPKTQIELLRGETSREKTWRIPNPRRLPPFISRP